MTGFVARVIPSLLFILKLGYARQLFSFSRYRGRCRINDMLISFKVNSKLIISFISSWLRYINTVHIDLLININLQRIYYSTLCNFEDAIVKPKLQ